MLTFNINKNISKVNRKNNKNIKEIFTKEERRILEKDLKEIEKEKSIDNLNKFYKEQNFKYSHKTHTFKNNNMTIQEYIDSINKDIFREDFLKYDLCNLRNNFTKQKKEQEIKKHFIPSIFLEDVKKIINRIYYNDINKYIKDIQVYFSTFTLHEYYLANLSDKDLKDKDDIIKDTLKTNKSRKRRAKKIWKKTLWHCQCLLKLIGGKTGVKYISNSLEYEYKKDKYKQQQYIKNNGIITEEGVFLSLADVTITKDKRIAEHLNIIKTMEKFKEDSKNVIDWVFITPTLKPEFHPNPSKGKNSYNGTAPHISAKIMKDKLNNIRAYLKSKGIIPGLNNDYYGVYTSEPHQDGCQHLHIMFYYKKEDYEIIRTAFFREFPNLNDDQNNKNCSFIKNNGKASATSYLFKYLSKGTSAFDPDIDFFNIKDEQQKNALKCSAFHSYNSIRGIQFFGIENCLTKWRFLGRSINRIKVNNMLEMIVREKDFYSFIKYEHYKYIKNKYIKKDEATRFLGCIIDGVFFIKSLFAKVALSVASQLDKKTLIEFREDVIKLHYSEVLVNHNYSREATSRQLKPEKNYFLLKLAEW